MAVTVIRVPLWGELVPAKIILTGAIPPSARPTIVSLGNRLRPRLISQWSSTPPLGLSLDNVHHGNTVPVPTQGIATACPGRQYTTQFYDGQWQSVPTVEDARSLSTRAQPSL
ncbi:hypothetical protein GB937_002519 [Aspergillus fischeri]|nr:hypothetical protein GB937_002519 [Aspergillus fischeri]